ncbi:MAG: PrpR N-terminal domain-containing protein [Lachnospiraceae bacterium]|nr:PrpR N-terminal domain-containing protein [Lachnospiraceae bacterium]
MRKFRILCIPPYEGMRDLLDNIAAARSDVELMVHQGNLNEGLKVVRDKMKGSVDAILSRGCTTELIRENVSILTYDIAPSVYDILRIIRTAQETGEKYAVVGYQSITQSAKMLRNIIQYDFRVCTIHSEEECLENLNLLKSEGFQLIVGDMMAVNFAREMEMHSLLVTSGIESINSAVDATIDILQNYDAMNQRIDLFTEILHQDDDTTVVYNAEGELYYTSAEELPSELLEELRKNVANVIARGNLNIIRHRNRVVYTVSGKRIHTKGTEFCTYRIKSDQKSDMYDRYSIREVSGERDLTDIYPIEFYLGNDETASSLMEACVRYSVMNQPILFLGERGTGKERFGYYIYSHGKLKDNSMIIVDAGLMDDKGWKYLLESDDSPLNNTRITLYFKRMERIPAEWQNKFIIYLKESDIFRTNRLMFAYTLQDGAEPSDELYMYLTENVSCLRMFMPSLSERKADIPSLVSLYINVCNINHGTSVMGFTSDAMVLIQNHHWTRNVYQLYQAVQELVLNAEASYIPAESVRKYLDRKGNPDRNQMQQPTINLDRTLEEIERDIVHMVFEKEDMNQSRTAKHLGISRSTVWRLMKQ